MVSWHSSWFVFCVFVVRQQRHATCYEKYYETLTHPERRVCVTKGEGWLENEANGSHPFRIGFGIVAAAIILFGILSECRTLSSTSRWKRSSVPPGTCLAGNDVLEIIGESHESIREKWGKPVSSTATIAEYRPPGAERALVKFQNDRAFLVTVSFLTEYPTPEEALATCNFGAFPENKESESARSVTYRVKNLLWVRVAKKSPSSKKWGIVQVDFQ